SLLAFALLTTGWAALAVYTRPPGITPEGFDRIRAGMPKREVEAILGVPPGKYSDDAPREQVGDGWGVPLREPWYDYPYDIWFSYDTIILVVFHADGTVADKALLDFGSRPVPLWKRIGQWVRIPE